MKNLIMRSLTGVVFVAVLVGGLLHSALSFTMLFVAVTALAVWEFATNVNRHYGAQVNVLINTVSGIYFFWAFTAYCQGWQNFSVFVPYLLSLIYLPISELYLEQKDPLRNWSLAFASQIYVVLPFALLAVLGYTYSKTGTYSGILPLSVFVFLWASDTGAYCVGSLLGKYVPYKLFPRISPNKSWVGSIGGGLLTIVVAAVFSHFTDVMSLWHWIGLGLTICVFGTWGDLVESMFKRQLGIKDSGRILPGHGGMLDRFDSALLAIPAAVLYMYTLSAFNL